MFASLLSGGESVPDRHWQADEHVTTCPICGVLFSGVERKHHCRLCGRVLCKECSGYKLTYATYNLNGARGCDGCASFLRETLPTLTRGCSFLRFCRDGTQRRVTIALTPDHNALRVSLGTTSLPSARLLDHVAGAVDTYPLQEYRDILNGQQTATWKIHYPGLFSCCFGGDDVRNKADRSFSLVFGGATRQYSLDLLADTTVLKNKFSQCWNEFITRRNSLAGRVFQEIHESRVSKARERGAEAKAAQKERYSSYADKTRAKYFS